MPAEAQAKAEAEEDTETDFAAQRFQTLVETASDYAIFMLDTNGYVASWNEGAQRIKGYRADEIVGRHFSAFYLDEDRASGKCEHELATALEEGRFEDEGWRVRKDGSQFWANVVIAPLRDADGRHVGFSKITRDLTERRAAEIDRLQLARAQEALRLRDEFLSIASHELRTPLVALQLQLDSLKSNGDNLDDKQRSKIDRAARNVQRLADLISALLDVARISRGQLTLAKRPLDLGALVAEAVDRLEESSHAAHCEVTTSLPPDPIEGSWDPLRMGQVITNLLANAYKYAAGAAVDIELERAGPDAILRVSDRGPGISPEHLDRVFERFERATATRNHGGMGLGLYLTREIVLAHGGTIEARNREGGGTTIALRLPIDPRLTSPPFTAPQESP